MSESSKINERDIFTMKIKKSISVLLIAMFILSLFPSVAFASNGSELNKPPMSTFEDVVEMFPEANLSALRSGNAVSRSYGLSGLCFDIDAKPVATYMKKSEEYIHNLEVYEDGSYAVYGLVREGLSRNDDNYSSPITATAYYQLNSLLGTPAYFSFDYTHRTNLSTLVPKIFSVGNLQQSAGGILMQITSDIKFEPVWLSSDGKHAYRRAIYIENGSLDGNYTITVFTVGVQIIGREILPYKNIET